MNIEKIFLQALEKRTKAERGAFLDGACGTDVERRSRVEALLASHEEMGGLLDQPLFEGQPTLPPTICESPGTCIGPYKILQQIGEGGFGVVYMAEQQEPVVRKVALKVIKPGMDTKEVVARFEAERQALAMMDHPNIARVFDGGTTDSGRPFFVMELVRGIPITEYSDKNDLTTEKRLELFVPVCQAVQHAHQKGVIHRDIKPSNVLVTLHDGNPVVKVIDFGVAKAIHHRLTDKTLFTNFLQMVGTPLYMSPEQAELSGLDIDTRTDVYSLGVLLYELLVGAPPFDRDRLGQAAYDEMRRIIREEEPLRPSSRLSTLGDTLTDVCTHRKTEPARLTKLVSGDLDWIVMKAIEKDRSRRYETATEMAQDVQRHLKCEPVVAGPPSILYRLHKFVRRNRALVGTSVAICAAILLGLVFALVGFATAHQERDRAVAAREQAEQERERAEDQKLRAEREKLKADKAARDAEFALQIVGNALGAADPSQLSAADETMSSMLDALSMTLESSDVTNPYAEANIRYMLGRSYHKLGDSEHAIAQLRRALELQEDVFGKSHQKVADTLFWLSVTAGGAGQLAQSEAYARRGLEIWRGLAEDGLSVHATGAMSQVAVSLRKGGRVEEALALAQDALKLKMQFEGESPGGIAWLLLNMADCYKDLGNADEELEHVQKAMVSSEREGDLYGQWAACTRLAKAYKDCGRYSDSTKTYQLALRLSQLQGVTRDECERRVLMDLFDLQDECGDDEDQDASLQRILAIDQRRGEDSWDVWQKISRVHRKRCEYIEAIKAIKRALALVQSEGSRADEHTSQLLWDLSGIHLDRHDYEGQVSTMRQIQAIVAGRGREGGFRRFSANYQLTWMLEKVGDSSSADSLRREMLVRTRGRIENNDSVISLLFDKLLIGELTALLSSDARELNEAAQIAEDALANTDDPEVWIQVYYHCVRGLICNSLGDQDQAGKHALQAHELNADNKFIPRTSEGLIVNVLLKAGCHLDAEEVTRQGIESRTNELGEDHLEVAFARAKLAAMMLEREAYAQAEPLYEAAQGRLLDHPGVPIVRKRELVEQLIRLFEAMNETDLAQAWRQRLMSLEAEAAGKKVAPLVTDGGR